MKHIHITSILLFLFEINYLTKKSWVHGVDLGTTFNTINSLMANEYFTDAQFPKEITLHRPYKTNYIGYILGYQFTTKNIDFRPYQKVGYSRLDFPFYNLQNTQFGDSFIHEGDRPKSNSIYFETGLVTNIIIFKNTTLGLNISYRCADYDYSMIKRRVPGGSSRILVTDQVNLRAIMTGLRLAYKL
ncbi:hypothetical protein ACFOUP_08045 [Belliella kenyensis]|uniref:Outer membrane protein beta-barrel domain-containing protein n=1 Tax=Belliella kenyensis TaxID=1472724 RepID=A0ABV8EL92_9BACT|nr:hypothetical protein [Belliella kenyensis]MCH7400425.1 hypothetical protein [Belliella kenyensis]MDN3604558.1 hypothetical protein [Belliella kenyensis]